MGDISWNGVLLASRGNYSIDGYQDEELEGSALNNANIFYLSSNSKKQWTVSLKDNTEHIVSIAMGSSFSAAATDKHFIRFFSPTGLEFFVLGASRVITMQAYENLLAIFYHGSKPFSGE